MVAVDDGNEYKSLGCLHVFVYVYNMQMVMVMECDRQIDSLGWCWKLNAEIANLYNLDHPLLTINLSFHLMLSREVCQGKDLMKSSPSKYLVNIISCFFVFFLAPIVIYSSTLLTESWIIIDYPICHSSFSLENFMFDLPITPIICSYPMWWFWLTSILMWWVLLVVPCYPWLT